MAGISNKWIKEYLTFSQKDRRAVVFLFFSALVFALFPRLFPFLVKPQVQLIGDTALQAGVSRLKAQVMGTADGWKASASADAPAAGRSASYDLQSDAVLFPFDPNTASPAALARLGFRDKTIQTLLKYRQKGGRFRQPDDLQRLYGLRPEEYQRLKPFVTIAQTAETERPSFAAAAAFTPAAKEREAVIININTAGAAEWESLKGIGPGYAQRIIRYRNRLGGFRTVEQVGETQGLPDSVFQTIKGSLRFTPEQLHQLDLNSATADELAAHPYIDKRIARLIVAYRDQHGPYRSVNDLLQIHLIDEALLQKMAPYLVVNEKK